MINPLHSIFWSFFAFVFFFNLSGYAQDSTPISTSDIEHFWEAYDKVISTSDRSLQKHYLDSLYLQRGSIGLKAICNARNYTTDDYLEAIRSYPKFWNSIRNNTLKANQFSKEFDNGIAQLKKLYPALKPAYIYFTIGALRTNGTTTDSLVLIGSELAMADQHTISEEFPDGVRQNRRIYFDSNPIEKLVLLNIHEYVHTQQKRPLNNLLSYVIYEGVAEFVSVKALGVKSIVPAIEYGKSNPKVKAKFEREMYYGTNLSEWLWSDGSNEFGMRDLGYYIGYQLCELFYNQASNKEEAIKHLIELDYEDEAQIQEFVESTGFFTQKLDQLYLDFLSRRPEVVAIHPMDNKSKNVKPNTTRIDIEFSAPMNTKHRNFDYGPLGAASSLKIDKIIGWSEDGKILSIEVLPLLPNKTYQLQLKWGFRDLNNVPLMPFLIEFTTAKTN